MKLGAGLAPCFLAISEDGHVCLVCLVWFVLFGLVRFGSVLFVCLFVCFFVWLQRIASFLQTASFLGVPLNPLGKLPGEFIELLSDSESEEMPGASGVTFKGLG